MVNMSRRNFVGATAAGLLIASADAKAAEKTKAEAPKADGPRAPWLPNKLTWMLVSPKGSDPKKFQDFVIRDLAKACGDRVSGGVKSVTVTPQALDQWSSAKVSLGGADRIVDVALDIVPHEPYASVNDVNAHLKENCEHFQGWRMHATTIFDAFDKMPLGAPSKVPHSLVIIERYHGVTAEDFDKNWFMHAGHMDGREAESDEARERRATREKAGGGRRYVQNRVCEPMTPTAWLIHGITDYVGTAPYLFMPGTGPVDGMGPRDYRTNGEKIFEEWPPRILQGFEYRIV